MDLVTKLMRREMGAFPLSMQSIEELTCGVQILQYVIKTWYYFYDISIIVQSNPKSPGLWWSVKNVWTSANVMGTGLNDQYKNNTLNSSQKIVALIKKSTATQNIA